MFLGLTKPGLPVYRKPWFGGWVPNMNKTEHSLDINYVIFLAREYIHFSCYKNNNNIYLLPAFQYPYPMSTAHNPSSFSQRLSSHTYLHLCTQNSIPVLLGHILWSTFLWSQELQGRMKEETFKFDPASIGVSTWITFSRLGNEKRLGLFSIITTYLGCRLDFKVAKCSPRKAMANYFPIVVMKTAWIYTHVVTQMLISNQWRLPLFNLTWIVHFLRVPRTHMPLPC